MSVRPSNPTSTNSPLPSPDRELMTDVFLTSVAGVSEA